MASLVLNYLNFVAIAAVSYSSNPTESNMLALCGLSALARPPPPLVMYTASPLANESKAMPLSSAPVPQMPNFGKIVMTDLIIIIFRPSLTVCRQ